MEIAGENGLEIKALMSIGHPGEDHETLRATQAWLLEVKPADFDITIITPYPGCPYYDEAVEITPDLWRYSINEDSIFMLPVDYSKVEDYYKGDPEGGYKSYVYTIMLSGEMLVGMRDAIDREVREKLGISPPTGEDAVAIQYESSMGMTPQMLRR